MEGITRVGDCDDCDIELQLELVLGCLSANMDKKVIQDIPVVLTIKHNVEKIKLGI